MCCTNVKVEMEINEGAKYLIVGEAPGPKEVEKNKPFFNSGPNSAGGKLEKSFNTHKRKRSEFSITNVYKYFPGRAYNSNKILPPSIEQINNKDSIQELLVDISICNPEIVFCIGDVAFETLKELKKNNEFSFKIRKIIHPTSSDKNKIERQYITNNPWGL